MTDQILAGRLQEIMGTRGLTQAALAEAVGTSPAAVSQWLSGRKRPTLSNLEEIARVLDVPLSVLLEGAEVPRDEGRERAAYQETLQWYWRPAPPDEGRELGNAAAFAFDPTVRTLGRETGQNSVDEQLGNESVWLDYAVIELTGGALDKFLSAVQFGEVRPHLEAATQSQQKVGNVIRAGLRSLDEDGRLLLIRVSDFNAHGLTGLEYSRGRFTAVCRNTLDSQKGETAGGSYGLGKATMWATSAFGLVLTNSDLSIPVDSQSENRFFGRLELPWHDLDGPWAGPAWLGEWDSQRTCTRSYLGNATLAHDLYLGRDGDSPGTSFLIVGAFDPSGKVESPEEIAAELRRSIGENFWPAMIQGPGGSSPKLRATVRVMRGRDQLSEHVVDPNEYVSPLVDALRKHREGEVVDVLEETGDVVQRKVELRVPERVADPQHDPVTHEVVVLVTQADEQEDLEANHVYYLRGNSMIIRQPRLSGLPLGARPFHAIVLAGEAAGAASADHQAEIFLRASEPPAHNQWTGTPDVTAAYRRGGPAALARLDNEIRNTIRDVIRGARTDESDGPQSLRELLRLVPPAPENPKRPRVKNFDGSLNEDGAWQIEAIVTIPPRSGHWRFVPSLQFATESGPGIAVKWAELSAESDCEIDGRFVKTNSTARTIRFAGVSNPRSHPAAAKRARVLLDLREVRSEDNEA
jgi:transcriptional regulator with XRE-family HTH domain